MEGVVEWVCANAWPMFGLACVVLGGACVCAAVSHLWGNADDSDEYDGDDTLAF